MTTTGYADHSDFALIPALKRLVPREIDAFFEFDHAAFRTDGAIPLKIRELIAVAIALTTQCEYCIDVHTARAISAGASREELAEAAVVAAAVRAGGALAHALLSLKLADRAPLERSSAGADPSLRLDVDGLDDRPPASSTL
jgi:AhpD family alkylhydroperoxidase